MARAGDKMSASPLLTMITPRPYAIVLDDHPLVGRSIAQYLQFTFNDLPVSQATRWSDVLHLQATQGCPQLLVADVWLADGQHLNAMQRWCGECPGVLWLAISGDDDPGVARRVRAAGARGFVPKKAPPETFGAALLTVMSGGSWFAPEEAPLGSAAPRREWAVSPGELGLTARQGEILQLVLRGLPNKRIASSLGISESTVKEHVTGILDRLGVGTRVQAIALLRGRRLELPGPP